MEVEVGLTIEGMDNKKQDESGKSNELKWNEHGCKNSNIEKKDDVELAFQPIERSYLKVVNDFYNRKSHGKGHVVGKPIHKKQWDDLIHRD